MSVEITLDESLLPEVLRMYKGVLDARSDTKAWVRFETMHQATSWASTGNINGTFIHFTDLNSSCILVIELHTPGEGTCPRTGHSGHTASNCPIPKDK
jgi:hypothetical protein